MAISKEIAGGDTIQLRGLTEQQMLQTRLEAIVRGTHTAKPDIGEEFIHTLNCMREVSLTPTHISCSEWGVGRVQAVPGNEKFAQELWSGEVEMGNRKIKPTMVQTEEPPLKLDSASSLKAKIQIVNEMVKVPGLWSFDMGHK